MIKRKRDSRKVKKKIREDNERKLADRWQEEGIYGRTMTIPFIHGERIIDFEEGGKEWKLKKTLAISFQVMNVEKSTLLVRENDEPYTPYRRDDGLRYWTKNPQRKYVVKVICGDSNYVLKVGQSLKRLRVSRELPNWLIKLFGLFGIAGVVSLIFDILSYVQMCGR